MSSWLYYRWSTLCDLMGLTFRQAYSRIGKDV